MPVSIHLVEGRRQHPSCVSFLETGNYQIYRSHTRRDALALTTSNGDSHCLTIVDGRQVRFQPDKLCQDILSLGARPVLLVGHPPAVHSPIAAGFTVVAPPLAGPTFGAIVRRLVSGPSDDALVSEDGQIILDPDTAIVSRNDCVAPLTPQTADLLKELLEHEGMTLTRAFLMRRVWHTDYTADTGTLDVHVHWLRRALGETPSAGHVKTVRGVGYRFDTP